MDEGCREHDRHHPLDLAISSSIPSHPAATTGLVREKDLVSQQGSGRAPFAAKDSWGPSTRGEEEGGGRPSQ